MIAIKPQGFTLLELLIAMAIFSLISIMSFSGLSSVLFNKEVIDIELKRISAVQRSMLNLARDIEQSVDRPIRDELGSTLPALTGGQNIDSVFLELTRAGWRNPARQNRSQLQRVAYSFEDNQLIRIYWYHLDHLQSSEPVRRVLLTGVESIEVRYLDTEWVSSWPDLTQTQQSNATALPRAIEITVELTSWGKITRLFRLRT